METPFAIWAAWSGVVALAEMLRTTVPAGDVTVTCCSSCSPVMPRPRSATTSRPIRSLVASAT